MPAKNLMGMQFGRLTVLEMVGRDKHSNVMWLCRCECGQETVVRAANLISAAVISCGCASGSSIKHGDSGKRLYRIYKGILRRIDCPERKEYKNFGALGIGIAKEWRESYSTFKAWAISNGYADNLSICRRDKTADYTPENCFWGTTEELRKTGYAHRHKNPAKPVREGTGVTGET